MFVKNAAVTLFVRIITHVLHHKQQDKTLSGESRMTQTGQSGDKVHSQGFQPEHVKFDPEVDRLVLQCLDVYVSDLQNSSPSTTSVSLGIMLRLCEHLHSPEVYCYMVENLRLPVMLAEVIDRLTYRDIVTALEVLSACRKLRYLGH